MRMLKADVVETQSRTAVIVGWKGVKKEERMGRRWV